MSENKLMLTANSAATGAVAGAGLAMALKPSKQAVEKEAALLLKPIEDAFVKEGSRLTGGISKAKIIDAIEKLGLKGVKLHKDLICSSYSLRENIVNAAKNSKVLEGFIKSFTETLKKDPKLGNEIFDYVLKNRMSFYKLARKGAGFEEVILNSADFKKLSKEAQQYLKNLKVNAPDFIYDVGKAKFMANFFGKITNGGISKLEGVVQNAKSGVKGSYNNVKKDILNSQTVKDLVTTKLKFKNAGKFAAIGAAVMAAIALVISVNKTK